KSKPLKAPDGQVYYYHSDHLGSSTVVTNSSGGLYQSLQYYPYGRTRINSLCGGSGEGCVAGVTHKYTSQEQDSSTAIGTDVSTSLYYYRARYYDPVIGRFISADTVTGRSPQKLNRYSYVLNNPMRYTDPTGHVALNSGCMGFSSCGYGYGGGSSSGFGGSMSQSFGGVSMSTSAMFGNGGAFPSRSSMNPPGMATAFPTGVNPGLMGPSKYQGISLSTSNIKTIQSNIPGDIGGSSITTTTSMVSGNEAFSQYYKQYGSFFSGRDIAQMTWDRSRFWDDNLTTRNVEPQHEELKGPFGGGREEAEFWGCLWLPCLNDPPAELVPEIGGALLGTKEYIDYIVRKHGLSKEQRQMLHREITGKDYSPEEIEQAAENIKHNFPHK
ncbi:MAG: hypothetical protein L0Y56_22800, partial [Nitrospira sp.]|nr:hypothetical protein [Nitrospira sp.]